MKNIIGLWLFSAGVSVLVFWYVVNANLVTIEHLTIDTVLGYGVGLIASFFLVLALQSTQNKTVDAYKRQLEKTSINSTESSSKVQVLEQKIEVLEKALQNALKK